ncbi:tetratricopeptide repeat protein [Ferruginibacter sp. SUN002]|uniref:ATP-binding protein n=1 Tax=Ferruginibacter sp. SUN002 TaxID=2937789 RepID=UPI003D35FA2A
MPKFLTILLICYSGHSVAQDSVLLNKGVALYNKSEYDSSLNIFNDCLITAKQSNNKKNMMVIYNYLGHIYSQTGNPEASVQQYQLLETLAEETGDKKTQARAMLNTGALAEEQKDYKKALAKYSSAEDIAIALKDSSLIADCANNKGVVYEQYLQKYPEALKEYNLALSIYTKLNDQRRMAMSYNNIGIVYKHIGNYTKAIEYYKSSLHIAENNKDQFMIAANMTNIGNVYAMLKDYKKAIDYNSKGLDIAMKINAMNVVAEAASSIADDYAGMKDYKNAYEWHKKFSAYSDTLFNTENAKQVAELESKYQTTKKEKEILQLKQQQKISDLLLQKRKYQFIGFIITGSFIGIVVFLLYNRQRLRQKQMYAKALLDAEYRDRKRISREMHDDIGSGLTQITLMSEYAQNNYPEHKKEFTEIAITSRNLISNMSEIVWSLNPENKTLDLLFSYLREQLNKLLEYSGIDFTINFPEVAPDIILTNEQRRTLLLISKEITNNAVKYSKAKQISIDATLTNNKLQFIIKDDGIGFDTSIAYAGNGMKNIQHRIHEVNGNLEFESSENKGSRFAYSIIL